MPTSRRVSLAAVLAVPLALASCGKKKPDAEQTQPPIAPVPAAPADDTVKVVEPAPAAEKITVTGSVEALDDLMAATKKFSESFMPDSAVDPKAEIQSMLLGVGFGPGFLNNIDLGGVHAFSTASPADGGRPEDTDLSASVAVVDARKLIDSMPSSQRPSPLGEGMWEMMMDESTRLLLREQGKELLVGLSTKDIDAAGKLRAQAGTGRRIRLRATNIPGDEIDPAAVLDELPVDSKLVKDLSAVLRDLDAVTFETDLGTDRDFQIDLGVTAPFKRLGLDPIGAPRAAATALESRLPADPVVATTMSWGDPALLHKLLDQVPMDQIPDPVKPMVTKALTNTHALLDQIANDVAFALYIDKKGRATVVMATDVRDEAKAQAGLRGLGEVMLEGVQTQATMAGKAKDKAFSASLKVDGVKVAGGKADRLTIKIPKGFSEDTRQAKMFLRKNSVEMVTLVKQGTAVVAIGAGAQALVADVAKSLGGSRRRSLAQNQGLEVLRKSMGGCQVCVISDPLAYFRFRLMLVRDGAEDKKVVKKASEKLYGLSKLSSIGQGGVGLKIEAEAASMGLVVPKTTLFAPADTIKALREINEFVGDPGSGTSSAEVQVR